MKQSEVLFKKLVEHMNEALWMGDKNERTVYANPKFCAMVGYSLDEIVGQESYIFWDKESADRVRNVNKNHRKKGISSSYEGNLLTKKGEKIPVLLSGTPLPDGGSFGIITDLTILKKNESLYKRLVENMNEALWMGDKDEKTIYANPKFCKLVGYSLEEILGKESYAFWDKESADRVWYINQHHRKKGAASSYEGKLLAKDGRKIPVSVNGTPIPDGGTIGIITDLTELKQKETSERVLNSAVEYASDAIVIFNSDGKITSWNKGAKIIFGYKKDEMLGEKLNKIFTEEEVEGIFKNPSVLYNFETLAFHKNKTALNISATLTPIFNGEKNKASYYLLMIARDITSQKKFEEEMAMRYQKIQDAYNRFGVLRRQMDYIFELLDMTRNADDHKSLADFLVTSVIMLTRVDACVLRKYNAERDTLDLISFFGLSGDWEGKASLKYKKSLAEKAFLQAMGKGGGNGGQGGQGSGGGFGGPLKIIDVTKEPRYHSAFLAKKNNVCSLLLIPLIFRGKLVGTLSLYARPDKKLEIFDNMFIEKYARLLELIVGTVWE